MELDNLTVKIYTQSGKGLGFFDDENWEDTIEIIKEHLENGNVVVMGKNVEGIDIL